AFIVYTSNVFAILGLRSLYFALEHFFSMFRFLHYGLALVLTLVGLKMLVSHFYEPSLWITLGLVLGILAVTVLASLIWPEKAENRFRECVSKKAFQERRFKIQRSIPMCWNPCI